MEEKIEATSSEEGAGLTQEEEEAAIHWKTKANHTWTPEEGENKGGAVPSEPSPEEEAETRQMLEETRRRAEEINDEELHPAYKKMACGAITADPEEEKEEIKVHYAKCEECGTRVPYSELHDNGSYLVCSKCC